MNCKNCNCEIPAERVEALPNVQYCVKCANTNPEPLRHDPNDCDRGSASARNGWGRSD